MQLSHCAESVLIFVLSLLLYLMVLKTISPGSGVWASPMLFFGRLRVTNPPIRLMCLPSICVPVRQHFGFQAVTQTSFRRSI